MEHAKRRRTVSHLQDQIKEFAEINLAPSTGQLYQASLLRFAQKVGDKPLRSITTLDVEKFKNTRAKDVSRVRVNIEFRTLKAAFNHAIRWGMVDRNVFASCKPLRVPAKDPVYLTKEEFVRLITEIDDRDFKFLLMFAALTGMRRGEIINLTWNDINFLTRMIRIRNTDSFTVKTTKPRNVPIPMLLVSELERMARPTGYVFPEEGGARLVGGSVSRKFKGYAQRTGLSPEVHFHSLRHSAASWLVQQSVPLYAVQKLLGHSSPAVTQIYAHMADENLRTAIDAIELPSQALTVYVGQ